MISFHHHRYKGPPTAFIQQVIVKSAITPWSNELLLTDAFRGPLAEVFHIVDLMKQFQLDNKYCKNTAKWYYTTIA